MLYYFRRREPNQGVFGHHELKQIFAFVADILPQLPFKWSSHGLQLLTGDNLIDTTEEDIDQCAHIEDVLGHLKPRLHVGVALNSLFLIDELLNARPLGDVGDLDPLDCHCILELNDLQFDVGLARVDINRIETQRVMEDLPFMEVFHRTGDLV